LLVYTKIVKPVGLEDVNVIPKYAKPGDAGCDGVAAITAPMLVRPGKRVLIPLGICVAIPLGYEIQMRPRSGLALKHGITLCNSPGTIDAGYRNEIGAILINHGEETVIFNPGDRICQLVLNKVEHITWEEVEELPASVRGMGGFGHTGVVNV
jgi:dUTP pyrophosphatase